MKEKNRTIEIKEVMHIVDCQMYMEFGDEPDKLPFSLYTVWELLKYMDKCNITFQTPKELEVPSH